ncbi:MAG: hypothetical protein R6U27_06300 [Desulfobacterales bacterium]
MMIKGLRKLKHSFDQLSKRDIYIGSVTAKHLEYSMMIDLLEREVTCLPFCLSQLLSGSKTSQALILKEWMHPLTRVITRRIELLNTISFYNKNGVGPVVTKEDQKHCGHGVRLWNNIENLYSILGLEDSSYPFVVQPFVDNFTDVRVIIVGEYIEAYTRENPYNFRCNLSAGGMSKVYDLSRNEIDFCKKIMERGKFLYAHIDLMVFDNGVIQLSEIALNGGLKGAKIDHDGLDLKKQQLLEKTALHLNMKSE